MNMCAAPTRADGVDRRRDGRTGIICTTGQGLLQAGTTLAPSVFVARSDAPRRGEWYLSPSRYARLRRLISSVTSALTPAAEQIAAETK
jgi:hypothetical protein